MNKILSGAKFVVENAKQVKINPERLKEFSKNFHHGDVMHWLAEAPVDFSKLNPDEILNFLLVYSSIGFCYWGERTWTIKYQGKNHTGSFAMIAAIRKAHENGIPILHPEYRAKIGKEDFSKILEINSENKLHLLDERLKFFHESGQVIVDKYHGKVLNLINSAEKDVLKLLEILIQNFSAYQDSSKYNGKEIYFYKKAQLFISDVFQIFGGKSVGQFNNPQELTALADYRIPQVLRNFGIFEYSKELAAKINKGTLIPQGSAEEIELRASTIWVVELIYEAVKDRDKRLLPIGVNDHLWLLRRQKFPEDNIFHKTITAAY